MTVGSQTMKGTAEPVYTQVRVRLNEDGAWLLHDLLEKEEQRMLGLRKELVEARVAVDGPNQLLARIRRVKKEVDRAIDELG